MIQNDEIVFVCRRRYVGQADLADAACCTRHVRPEAVGPAAYVYLLVMSYSQGTVACNTEKNLCCHKAQKNSFNILRDASSNRHGVAGLVALILPLRDSKLPSGETVGAGSHASLPPHALIGPNTQIRPRAQPSHAMANGQ